MLQSAGLPEYNAQLLVACRDKLLQRIQAASGPTSPVEVTPVDLQQAVSGFAEQEPQRDQTLPSAQVSDGPADI